MSHTHTDIEQIKETLSKMQAQINVLEYKFNCVNPQCMYTTPTLTGDYTVPLSAARSMWPMLEKEFDEYCTKRGVTVWTPNDSEQFYNEFIRCRC